MAKRVKSAITLVIVLALLVSCGNAPETEATSEETEETTIATTTAEITADETEPAYPGFEYTLSFK